MNEQTLPLLPERMYHIYNHANGNENLFTKDENYIFFLKKYAYFIEPIADTFAYCLMPNHIHFLVRIKNENQLQEANIQFLKDKDVIEENINTIPEDALSKFISRIFGNLFSSYTQSYNKKEGRKGSLFIPKFKRKEVSNEEYYTQLIFYVHNNPVHHGFVENMEDWLYSSIHAFISEKNTKVCKEEVFIWFGDKEHFTNFHNEMSEAKVETNLKFE